MDFAAVLLLLPALLRHLVAIKLAFDLADHAVEDVDGGPEKLLKIRLQPRLGEGGGDGVENIRHRPADALRLGQRPWVRLVGEGTVAIHLKFSQHMGGRGCGVVGFETVGRAGHGTVLREIGRAHV